MTPAHGATAAERRRNSESILREDSVRSVVTSAALTAVFMTSLSALALIRVWSVTHGNASAALVLIGTGGPGALVGTILASAWSIVLLAAWGWLSMRSCHSIAVHGTLQFRHQPALWLATSLVAFEMESWMVLAAMVALSVAVPLASRSAWKKNRSVLRLASCGVAMIWRACAYAYLFDAHSWLPAEIERAHDGSLTVVYTVADQADYLVLLDDQTRAIRYVRAAELSERTSCRVGTIDPIQRLIAGLWDGPTEPACYRDGGPKGPVVNAQTP